MNTGTKEIIKEMVSIHMSYPVKHGQAIPSTLLSRPLDDYYKALQIERKYAYNTGRQQDMNNYLIHMLWLKDFREETPISTRH